MSHNIRRPGTYALALAALILTTTTALPAFALTPAPISASLRDQAATPLQTVQYQKQAKRQRTARTYRDGYRDGYNAYASAPRVRRSYGYQGYANPWGHCAMLGAHEPGRSAFPDWDVC